MKCKRIMSLLLALCLMVGVMVIPAKAVEVTDGKVNAVNYYTASGISTNGHYIAKGIFVQEDGDAYIILALDKNDKVKEVRDVAIEVNGSTTHVTDPDVTFVTNTPTLTVLLPGGSSNNATSSSNTFLLVRLGKLHDIATLFFMSLATSAGGWDMMGMEVHVNLNYAITKTVDKAEIDPGASVVYTVTITNTGDHAIYGINIYDNVPQYLTITGVAGQTEPKYPADERLLLDENISLLANESKTYTVYARVSDDVPGGTEIINTATMESSILLPAEAQATVTVNPYFRVYHQATNQTDRIMMHQLDDTTFDITQPLTNREAYAGVTTNYLYGGIYTDSYFTTPISNECGVKLVPENNRTYYLKEVPDYYLCPKIYHIYDKNANNTLKRIYLLTAIDDRNYQYVGFDVNSSEPWQENVSGNVYEKIEVYKRPNWTAPAVPYQTLTAKGVYSAINNGVDGWNDGLLNCQMYANYQDDTASRLAAGQTFTMLPYYVTMDNVKVTGVYNRRVSTGNGTFTNNTTPGLTSDDGIKIASTTSEYNAPANKLTLLSAYSIVDEPVLPEIKTGATLSLLNKKTGDCEASINLGNETFSKVYFEYTYRGRTFTVAAEQVDGLYTASWKLDGLRNKDTVTVTACGVTKDGVEIRGEAVEYLFKGNRMVRQ